MKKLLAFLLAAVLVLGLFGCGGAEEAKKPEGLLTCSEGAFSYIASTDAFDFNSYESYCCYLSREQRKSLSQNIWTCWQN